MGSGISKRSRSKKSTRRGADRPSPSTSQQSTSDSPCPSRSQQSTADRTSCSKSQQSTSSATTSKYYLCILCGLTKDLLNSFIVKLQHLLCYNRSLDSLSLITEDLTHFLICCL